MFREIAVGISDTVEFVLAILRYFFINNPLQCYTIYVLAYISSVTFRQKYILVF